MRTGFDIRTDVVLEHCCHCYDNLGLRMCFWTKDTRSCSSHGQSDYLRSSFSTKKEYSNLSSKIQKVDCNTNSAMVFNLGSLRPVTRTLLVSCTSPGVNLWRYESFQDLWENHCFFYGLARRYRQLFWEDIVLQLVLTFSCIGFICSRWMAGGNCQLPFFSPSTSTLSSASISSNINA